MRRVEEKFPFEAVQPQRNEHKIRFPFRRDLPLVSARARNGDADLRFGVLIVCKARFPVFAVDLYFKTAIALFVYARHVAGKEKALHVRGQIVHLIKRGARKLRVGRGAQAVRFPFADKALTDAPVQNGVLRFAAIYGRDIRLARKIQFVLVIVFGAEADLLARKRKRYLFARLQFAVQILCQGERLLKQLAFRMVVTHKYPLSFVWSGELYHTAVRHSIR